MQSQSIKTDDLINYNYIDKKIINKVENIYENIQRVPGIFHQVYYLCKDYKDNRLDGSFKKDFNCLQRKVEIIKKIIYMESKYILDNYKST